MDQAAFASSSPQASGVVRWAWGPPGKWFYLATAGVVIAALDADSRLSFGLAIPTAFAGLILVALWLLRFAASARSGPMRISGSPWLRWLGVPALFALGATLTFLNVPYATRLELSRGAMDRAAIEVMAGGPTNRGWVGLYPVERVERIPGGMRFLIAGSGFLDPMGFAYVTNGVPPNVGGEDLYQHLDGRWWLWEESW